MLTQAELKELLHYDPETGMFTWKFSGKGRKLNKIAGSKNINGYIYLCVHGKKYLAHRLAWMYIYGFFPEKEIDHINKNKIDNRIKNLRSVTSQQNKFNLDKQKNNTSGYIGVSWNNFHKKYHSYIWINGKRKSLKYHDCPKKAHEAYLKAKLELHVI